MSLIFPCYHLHLLTHPSSAYSLPRNNYQTPLPSDAPCRGGQPDLFRHRYRPPVHPHRRPRRRRIPIRPTTRVPRPRRPGALPGGQDQGFGDCEKCGVRPEPASQRGGQAGVRKQESLNFSSLSLWLLLLSFFMHRFIVSCFWLFGGSWYYAYANCLFFAPSPHGADLILLLVFTSAIVFLLFNFCCTEYCLEQVCQLGLYALKIPCDNTRYWLLNDFSSLLAPHPPLFA